MISTNKGGKKYLWDCKTFNYIFFIFEFEIKIYFCPVKLTFKHKEKKYDWDKKCFYLL